MRASSRSIRAVLWSALVLPACSESAPDTEHAAPPSDPVCPPGEPTLPDGRCQPAGLPLDMACPPGEIELPDGRCQPAGVPGSACAEGFVAIDGGGCEAVLPQEVCPYGTMAIPGESACREVTPCGVGRWGDIPVEATTQHVDQAFPGTDSDGSLGKPWKTIQEGVDAAAPNAIVAIAEGRYEEDLSIAGKSARLWGRCPARVEVAGLGAQQATIEIVDAEASGSEVRGLAVTGTQTGIIVSRARSVALQGVWIHENDHVGLAVVGGAAGVTLRGALVEKNVDRGVTIEGSEVRIEATAVRDTQLSDTRWFGWGIAVEPDPTTGARGKLEMGSSLIERNHQAGVLVAGADATIEGTVLRATYSNGAGWSGAGAVVLTYPTTGARGKLEVRTSLIEQNRGSGVGVGGADVTIEATVVRRNLPNVRGFDGRGIAIEVDKATGARGSLDLRSSLVEQNADSGVHITNSDARVEATIVRAGVPNDGGVFGWGITIYNGETAGERGTLDLRSSVVEQNHQFGVVVTGSDARIESTVVRATQPSLGGGAGWGIAIGANGGERAKLELLTSLIEQNHGIGVAVAQSDATIEATVVRGTQLSPDNLPLGDGILIGEAPSPSTATIRATETAGNARAGILYTGSMGEVSGVRSNGNRFGLVLQFGESSAQPTVGDGNAFESNTEKDRIDDGDLPVPDEAPELP